MSQINVGTANASILKLGSYNGIDNFPTGLSAGDAGSMVFDSSTGQLAFWDGTDWKLVKGGGTQDGLTADGAFSQLSDVADKGYTGIQTLYTTFNETVAPVEVQVNFSVPNGPWYMVSFAMPAGYRWDADNMNGTVGAGVYNNTNSTHSSTTRPRRTGTVPNMGTRQVGEIYNVSQIESVSNAAARGWHVGGAGYNTGWKAIEYYNHGTQTNFSLSEITALRNIVTQLSSYTPHCGLEIDAQGLGSATNWRQDYTGNIGGHGNWLRIGNDYMRSTPSENASDERGVAFFWTHNSYQAELFGGGSLDYAVSGGTPAGLPNGFILPDAVKFSGTTGGGSMFGTPYMNFSGFENRRNNRNYFLCK